MYTEREFYLWIVNSLPARIAHNAASLWNIVTSHSENYRDQYLPIERICKIVNMKPDMATQAMKALQSLGLARFVRLKNGSQFMGSKWTFFKEPQSLQPAQNQASTGTGKTRSGNCPFEVLKNKVNNKNKNIYQISKSKDQKPTSHADENLTASEPIPKEPVRKKHDYGPASSLNGDSSAKKQKSGTWYGKVFKRAQKPPHGDFGADSRDIRDIPIREQLLDTSWADLPLHSQKIRGSGSGDWAD
jgi:hypothetical protein